MENIAKRIQGILATAENELRLLIAEAAQSGEYQHVEIVRSIAIQVNDLIRGLNPRVERHTKHGDPKPQSFQRKGKGKYPRFFIRKDILHKVGWSKKDRQEYVHKIPKEAFDQTIGSIRGLVKSGKIPFLAEDIGTEAGAADTSIPIYQVYLALALLRDRGIVQREGRDGYRAKPEISELASKLWTEIERTGV